jgi:predicted Zn-dependent protease
MADSYYNLGNYAKAAGYYRTLIRPGIQADLLDSAMNGLVWSAKQSTEVDLLTELDRLIAQPNGEALRPRLMLRKAEWLLDKKRYDDAGAVCNQIIEGYPRYEQLNRVYGVLAQCYRAQGQAGRAESAYADCERPHRR